MSISRVWKALVLVSALLLAGGAGSLCARSLSEQMALVNAPLYQVGSQRWITLNDFAFVVNGEFRPRPGETRLEVSFRQNRAIFLLGSRRVLFNGKTVEMSLPARRVNGLPAIPYEFADRLSRPGFDPGLETAAPRPPDEGPAVTAAEPGPAPLTPPAGTAPGLSEVLSRALHPGLEETIAEAIQEKPRILVIDPGHGGRDAGAIGPYGLKEKDVVLDIALRLRDYLKRKRPEMEILITRETDVFISLERRVQVANQAQADLFISVHANDARLNRHTANGFETFFPASKPALAAAAGQRKQPGGSLAWASPLEPIRAVEKSRYLAELIQEELSDVYIKDIPDRGVKRRNFFVLRDTLMPAVLVEVGFISNPLIEANLRQPQVRQAIAEALGRGIAACADLRPLRGVVEVDTSESVPPSDGTH